MKILFTGTCTDANNKGRLLNFMCSVTKIVKSGYVHHLFIDIDTIMK